jgi:Asp-tRNA(Asn)/Glu-tRNA(Gln) amidotransferase A subunit family amidase
MSEPTSKLETRPSRGLVERRDFLSYFGAMGLSGTLLPGVLWAQAQEAGTVTRDMLVQAEKISGLSFTDEERDMMLEGLQGNLRSYRALHAHDVDNEVPPALHFEPRLPGRALPTGADSLRYRRPSGLKAPADLEEAAFWSLAELGELIRTGQVSSQALTEMYLARLKQHGPTLECVVTLTEERAMAQARQADRELSQGVYRGPLHGIPWGGKDLLAVEGYPTTWGAMPYREQQLEYDASVVRRLDAAGAVLVAKLTLGALAMGDYWFGGRTRNPWNLEQGSSGSSAGSASATVAGLVGFSIGTETLGSIVSPSTRCGASGLRPSFGRVSRYGAMALSWSMDKIGPICRSAEDCALVFSAIHGADGLDPVARTVPFRWDGDAPLSSMRIGYIADAFDGEGNTAPFDDEALSTLRGLGIDPVPVELPNQFPLNALRIILNAEAAAAFSDLTLSGRDDQLVRQTNRSWPNSFRTARMIPAVEYIQANRVRTQVMGALDTALEGVDVVLTPSYASDLLLMTNLTGHPVAVVPHGFTDEGTPVSFSFLGNLWKDDLALRVAKAFQDATDFHSRRPPQFG